MNRPEVIEALRAVLDPESEPYKKAFDEGRVLDPKWTDLMRAHELAQPLAEVLMRQPEYIRYPQMMLRRSGVGPATGLQPSWAAELLVARGMKAGVEVAVNWLADVVERSSATGKCVMPIWQLTVEAPLRLTRTIDIVPFSMLAPSFPRSWLENFSGQSLGRWMLPGPFLSTVPPMAAITERVVIDPLFVNAGEEFQPEAEPTPRPLDDVRLCLSAIHPNPVLGPVHWFVFDDAELNAMSGPGIGAMPLEILPNWLPAPVGLDVETAQMLVPEFLALRKQFRDPVRTSLQRLVQAMLRREAGDKAADLSIALEALLTDQPGEHTWKVSTRAAVITGWDLQSMLDRRNVIVATYRMRSSLVHSGGASKRVDVPGRGRQPASAVCDEAARICAAVIRAIVERGGIPCWPEFDVSGGVLGWPHRRHVN
jgi:hypothetical protein